MEEILKRSLLIRGRAFATFSAIEIALAGSKKTFRGTHSSRGPSVVQACHRLSSRLAYAGFTVFPETFDLMVTSKLISCEVVR